VKSASNPRVVGVIRPSLYLNQPLLLFRKKVLELWQQISPRRAKIAVCLLGALIAAVDVALPANIDVATFYFALIVLVGWTRSFKWLWISTISFILLTFAGISLGAPPIDRDLIWVDWLNRSMTALALAVLAVPIHLLLRAIVERERAERALQESHDLLEKRVEERTSALAVVIEELQKENANRIQAEGELRESESSLRELSLELLRAQDEERRRLGQELHDGLGQCLSALKLSLHFVDQAIPTAEESARNHFAECRELTDDALSQVRTLSHLMYPPLLQTLGLKSTIPWYVRGFEQRSGVQTKLEMPQSLGRLPEHLELALFRILQESLTNIHRHSGSRCAHVGLKFIEGAVVLQIKDAGKGIQNSPFGIGLRSMQERAKELGGKVELSSGPGGTTVRATLPYRNASAAAS
jgi:signal transduction histidine kinase